MRGVEFPAVPKAFSPFALEMCRAFDAAGIHAGEDPGGPAGNRRAQFRRYLATVDQQDARRRQRLGDALGALVAEAATSKHEFLIKAAERDGFFFTNGTFREADMSASSVLATHSNTLSSIEELATRLHMLARDRPDDAVAGALELAESVCRATLERAGEPPPREKAAFSDVAEATLHVIAPTGENRARRASMRCRHAATTAPGRSGR